MAKRPDLAPLDAIRLVLRTCTMELQPLIHQVNAMPERIRSGVLFRAHQGHGSVCSLLSPWCAI